jgi:hypothetical protein
MPDEKRNFEAQTLEIKSNKPQAKVKTNSGFSRKNNALMETQRFSFSKDVILRLIDWLEKE